MFKILIPKWESCESNGNHFVMYLIQVLNTIDGKCHTIRKRYRDFHKLNKKIKKLINISIVLPPKRVRNMNHKFIEQRRQALERYLQNIALMDCIPLEVLHFLNISSDMVLKIERERVDTRASDVSSQSTPLPDNQPNDCRNRTVDHNSYPMIAFRQDINNICCSQTSSSSSLNDIIINGVMDGFYNDFHNISN